MKVRFKRIWVPIISATLLVVMIKPFQYYVDNSRYTDYIFEQWSAPSHLINDGYTDNVSYQWGQVSDVFINAKTNREAFLCLYDINGNKVDSVFTTLSPQSEQQNSSVLGYGYSSTFRYKIPRLKGGIYLWEKKIPFLIKGRQSRIGILYPTNTLNAYNISGGKSLYSIFSKQSHEVSFLRPMFPSISFQSYHGLRYFFNHKQYEFSYMADLDMEKEESVSGLDLLIIAGHSEYWTRKARLVFDKYVKLGGHAIILSGNTMWWQIRYGEANHSMICYKSTLDPIEDPLLRTINWSDSSLKYPISGSIVLDFTKGGYGRKSYSKYHGYHVTDTNHLAFKNVSFDSPAVLNIPSKEYDGLHLNFSQNSPKASYDSGFQNIALLGYDSITNSSNGAFVIARKNQSSGIIFNVGTMDWCSAYGLGGEDSLNLQIITDNMINICLTDSSTN